MNHDFRFRIQLHESTKFPARRPSIVGHLSNHHGATRRDLSHYTGPDYEYNPSNACIKCNPVLTPIGASPLRETGQSHFPCQNYTYGDSSIVLHLHSLPGQYLRGGDLQLGSIRRPLPLFFKALESFLCGLFSSDSSSPV